MKRMTAKRGLAALMTAAMGVSMFTTTGAIGVSADGPSGVKAPFVMSTSLAKGKERDKISVSADGSGGVKAPFVMSTSLAKGKEGDKISVSADGPGDVKAATAVMSTSLARCKDGDKIRNNESIDNIIKNYIKPIFKVGKIKPSTKDLRTMVLLWKKLNFDEAQSKSLVACLVEALKQTKENPNYLDHIYRYYNLENVRLAKDGIFIKIIGTLIVLSGSSDSAYYQIKKILRIIHSYVY